MSEHELHHSSVQEMDLGNGDLEGLDLLDNEEHSCPLLSSDPEQMRVTARKQALYGGQHKTSISSGDVNSNSVENNGKCQVNNTQPSFNFSHLLVLAFLFRFGLLLFSTWQDQTRWPDGQLRFTDVDYDVFTDAARAMLRGEDIYQARPTYRYSPLIAAVVAPGHWLFSSTAPNAESVIDPSVDTEEPRGFDGNQALARMWGKLVFMLADLVCAVLQYKIIEAENELHDHKSQRITPRQNRWAVWFILFGWLFNPITAVVSVRGNAEAVLGVCVLGCLLLLLKQRLFLAGLMFGLCIHLKIYPIIYSPAIYLWLSRWGSTQGIQPLVTRLREVLPSWKHVLFGLATIISFGSLTLWSYVSFGGMRFLWQAYLYHLTRIDIKHNFAPHFYPLYLLTGSKWKMDELAAVSHDASAQLVGDLLGRLRTSLTEFSNTTETVGVWDRGVSMMMNHLDLLISTFNVVAFLPAVLLIPRFSFKLCRQPGLCWFVITYVFVTFNKVCTSQYFSWSLVLLPIALSSLQLPSTHSPQRAIVESLLLWFGAQALWLASAYTLEMRTQTSEFMAQFVWRLVWFASMLFLAANTLLIRRFVRWRKPCSCMPVNTGILSSEKKTQ